MLLWMTSIFTKTINYSEKLWFNISRRTPVRQEQFLPLTMATKFQYHALHRFDLHHQIAVRF